MTVTPANAQVPDDYPACDFQFHRSATGTALVVIDAAGATRAVYAPGEWASVEHDGERAVPHQAGRTLK